MDMTKLWTWLMFETKGMKHKLDDINEQLASFQLTSMNFSRLLLPELGALRCNGVPLADSGVQKLGVEAWAWTVFRADLLSRERVLSEPEPEEAPDCKISAPQLVITACCSAELHWKPFTVWEVIYCQLFKGCYIHYACAVSKSSWSEFWTSVWVTTWNQIVSTLPRDKPPLDEGSFSSSNGHFCLVWWFPSSSCTPGHNYQTHKETQSWLFVLCTCSIYDRGQFVLTLE